MMPDFIIEWEGCRIIATNLWQNRNILHKKRSSMTVLDSSLKFSSKKWISLVVEHGGVIGGGAGHW
jgi:hypothetical protein